MKTRILLLCSMVVMSLCALPAEAQFTDIFYAPMNGNACTSSPGLGIDLTTGDIGGCGSNHVWSSVGAGTTQTFTHKTFDTAATGNSLLINGLAVTANTGTGAVVRAVGPTVGVLTATSINKLAITAPATGATLAVADGKTLTVSNTITLAAVADGLTVTAPTANLTGIVDVYQGTASTGITDGNFKVLTGPAISIPAGAANVAKKLIRVKGAGTATNAAASLLNVEISLCTVSGCATGTVVSPAGCVVTSTNQANNLTSGQFTFECEMVTASTGASGTLMAKADAAFNLGATTAAVLSRFADTATAVSSAVDLTVAEFVHPQYKFTTGNAGNSVVLNYMSVELGN